MIESNPILDALFPATAAAPIVPKPKKLAEAETPECMPDAETITYLEREAVTKIIDSIRYARATLDMLRDSGTIHPRVRSALAAADIYAGCAIAELRSTFLNYGKIT
jgi:hypothetical protein